jgi:hypothetical protein
VGRVAALVFKELREHLVAGIALFGLLFVALCFQLLFAAAGAQNMTLLQPYALYLWTFVPIAGVVLGNRLVVSEYYGRTQLFLEALPIRRWELLLVKFVLGLVVLQAAVLGALLISAVLSAKSEPVGGRFLWILSVRSAGFGLCLWSFLFVMGLLGKLRIPLYLMLGILLAVLSASTNWEPGRFGPFALAHLDTLPLEREVLPTGALLESLAVSGGCLAVAVGLGLMREGSVAEVLARPMSQREKSLAGIVVLGFMFALMVLDEKTTKDPFQFDEDDPVVRAEGVDVEVLYGEDDARPDAEALLAILARDVTELGDLLGRDDLPVLRVALRETLDGRTFEQAELEKLDGVLLRANFRRTAEWDELGFRAYAVGRLLRAATAGRAEFEPQAWVVDGFSRWWAERNDATPPAARPSLLRALHATAGGSPTEADLGGWYRTRERLGLPVAEGVAASGFWSLQRQGGKLAVHGLAKSLYGEEPPEDARATLRDWSTPFPQRFLQATGLEHGTFLRDWGLDLQRLRAQPPVAAALAKLPQGQATLATATDVGAIRHLDYAFSFQRPPPPGTPIALLHLELGPHDELLDPRELRRQEHTWPSQGRESRHRLTRYGAGTRVFVALEVESPALGCPVRLLAERRAIE